MHCAQARNQIALLVGDDLDDFECVEVERHMASCQSCFDYRSRMESLQQQLANVGSESGLQRGDSLWPGLEPAVRRAERERLVRRFNGWVAGVAVAAMVLAAVTISRDYTPIRSGRALEPVADDRDEWRDPGALAPAHSSPNTFATPEAFVPRRMNSDIDPDDDFLPLRVLSGE